MPWPINITVLLISPKNECPVEVSKYLAQYTICWWFWAQLLLFPVFYFLPNTKPWYSWNLQASKEQHILCTSYTTKRRGRKGVGPQRPDFIFQNYQSDVIPLDENKNRGRDRSEMLSGMERDGPQATGEGPHHSPSKITPLTIRMVNKITFCLVPYEKDMDKIMKPRKYIEFHLLTAKKCTVKSILNQCIIIS